MAARTAYVATESAGDVLTAANFDKLPGGVIGYASITANQTGIGASITDITNLSVAVTVNTSRIIRVTAFAIMQQAAGAGNASLYVRESTTTLGQGSFTATANAFYGSTYVPVIISASAGSHTYKASANTDANTVSVLASATAKAWIMVEDLGPNFT